MTRTSQARVLVVDDHENGREGLCELLRAWGFDVDAAGGGEHALEQARARQPDIVVTDLVMQVGDERDGDGCDIFRRLRAQGGEV